jgi:hypothetical protein
MSAKQQASPLPEWNFMMNVIVETHCLQIVLLQHLATMIARVIRYRHAVVVPYSAFINYIHIFLHVNRVNMRQINHRYVFIHSIICILYHESWEKSLA